MLPPTNWAHDPAVVVFDYDPERAKALLDEAGYRDPDGSGPRPRLSLAYKTTSLEFPRLQAAVIQQNLRDVGIELDVRSYEFATLYADILKGNFQMYAMQWVGGALADPDILRRVFHSQQVPPAGFNRGHFSDPEVDRLIDRSVECHRLRGAARALRKSAAADRRSRALHQPVAPDQLCSVAAATPGHSPLSAGQTSPFYETSRGRIFYA